MPRKPSRIQVPFVAETIIEIETGEKTKVKVIAAVSKAKYTITRRDEKAVKVYESESGAEVSNKGETNAAGQITVWVEEGPYLVTVEGGTPEIAKTSFAFDAIPGRGVESLVAIILAEEGIVTKTNLVAEVRNALIPVGLITEYGGNAAPTGTLACNGSEQKTSEYTELSALLGEKFGKAEKVGYFVLPKIANTKLTTGELISVIKY